MQQKIDTPLACFRIYSACDVAASLVIGVLGTMGLIAMAEKLATFLS